MDMDALRQICCECLESLRKIVCLGSPPQMALWRELDPTPGPRTRYLDEVRRLLDTLRPAQPQLKTACRQVEQSIAPFTVSVCNVVAPNAYAAVQQVLDKALRWLDGNHDVDIVFHILREIGIDLPDLDALEAYLGQQKLHDARWASQAPISLPPPALSDSHQEAYNLICKEGPLTAKEIVNRLGITSESNFTTHYVPKLKQHGIVNPTRGLGYYHPAFYKPNPEPS